MEYEQFVNEIDIKIILETQPLIFHSQLEGRTELTLYHLHGEKEEQLK